MSVCLPICVPANRCVCAKTSRNLQKCSDRENTPKVEKHVKSTKSTEIDEIHQNRAFIIDHFIRHFTLQMTGQVGDRFCDFGVRLPTKQSFLSAFFEVPWLFFHFSLRSGCRSTFWSQKRLPTGIIVHKNDHFFNFREAPEVDFHGFSWFSWNPSI